MYIVECLPAISSETMKEIKKYIYPEMDNNETSLYNLLECITLIKKYPNLKIDWEYLQELSDHDTHPRTYIEF